MRLGHLGLLVFPALLLAAGPAQATHLEVLDGAADCTGWQASGTIWFGSLVDEVTIAYTVDLHQDGAVVTSVSDEFLVATDAPYRRVEFGASGSWDVLLCGDYTVVGSFTMSYPGFAETLDFTLGLVCDCPPGEGCYRTPGYWKNHDWPVDALMIGGVEMTRDELMEILWTPVRGDATVILAKHLIAAKLNVIEGGDDAIQSTIDAADAFLADHPVGSRPGGALKHEANLLKDELVTYNEQGCPEDEWVDPDKSAGARENQSWSDLKSLYH